MAATDSSRQRRPRPAIFLTPFQELREDVLSLIESTRTSQNRGVRDTVPGPDETTIEAEFGEIVIPGDLMTPALRQILDRRFGDHRSRVVGSGLAPKNPATGLEGFRAGDPGSGAAESGGPAGGGTFGGGGGAFGGGDDNSGGGGGLGGASVGPSTSTTDVGDPAAGDPVGTSADRGGGSTQTELSLPGFRPSLTPFAEDPFQEPLDREGFVSPAEMAGLTPSESALESPSPTGAEPPAGSAPGLDVSPPDEEETGRGLLGRVGRPPGVAPTATPRAPVTLAPAIPAPLAPLPSLTGVPPAHSVVAPPPVSQVPSLAQLGLPPEIADMIDNIARAFSRIPGQVPAVQPPSIEDVSPPAAAPPAAPAPGVAAPVDPVIGPFSIPDLTAPPAGRLEAPSIEPPAGFTATTGIGVQPGVAPPAPGQEMGIGPDEDPGAGRMTPLSEVDPEAAAEARGLLGQSTPTAVTPMSIDAVLDDIMENEIEGLGVLTGRPPGFTGTVGIGIQPGGLAPPATGGFAGPLGSPRSAGAESVGIDSATGAATPEGVEDISAQTEAISSIADKTGISPASVTTVMSLTTPKDISTGRITTQQIANSINRAAAKLGTPPAEVTAEDVEAALGLSQEPGIEPQ